MKQTLLFGCLLFLSSALYTAENPALIASSGFSIEVNPYGGGVYYGTPYYSCPPGYYYRYGYYGPQCYTYGPGFGYYYYRGPYHHYYSRKHRH